MVVQVEHNERIATFARHDASNVDLAVLGATLLTTLEQALLISRQLIGALDSAAGHRAVSSCDYDEARPEFARPVARLQRAATAPRARPAPPAEIPCPYRYHLTAREVEVLRLIAAGMSNREMAAALCRSERTVERHIENIYRKIDAHSKADATAFAFRHRLA